jgi:predicted nuclease of predicted toxin-antitoxin system
VGNSPSGLERHTFLVERPLGKRVTIALREYGFVVVAFTDHFADGAPDEEWIAKAATEGWVVLTKDAAVRRRPNERLAIKNSGLRVFALTRGTWRSEEMSGAFIAAARRIKNLLKRKTGPFIARITKTGDISLVDDLGEPEEST